MSQTRRQSLIEAWTNIVAGLLLNTALNFSVFPLFGWRMTAGQNFALVAIYTCASLVRQYALRRAFNRWHQ
jgi:hypothetical protein